MKRIVILTLALTVLTAPAALADGPGLSETPGVVTLSWEQFVKITGYDPERPGSQVLTIPWSEVKALLGDSAPPLADGTTVDLTWTEFKALLEWSIKHAKAGDGAPPPMDYIVTSSQYSGDLTAEGATFTLTLKLDILRRNGWKRIPVLPNTVALTKTTFKPADGIFLNSQGSHYELLTEKSGSVEATIEFSVSVQKSGGINTVNFQRVAMGSSVLDLTVAREGVDVKVAGAQSLTIKPDGKNTKAVAAIPAGVPVSISWERALPKVEAVPAKLYAETRTLVAVADGLLLCNEFIHFNILHSPVRELKLAVPDNVSVLTVAGQNVQDWRVDNGTMSIILRGEVVGSYTLRVAYETAATDAANAPVLRALNVERERGFVGVVAVANVELQAGDIVGATQIDARQLPADVVAMTNQPVLLAFRYVGDEFTVPLTIKKHKEVDVLVTIVDSSLHTGMQLNDGRRITKVLYSVRNNRNQFLRLQMPAAAEIWSVAVNGNTVAPATDEAGQVLIPLVRSASRSSELASFPVEIVYVEKPAAPAPASGELTITLPTCGTAVPVMHVMYNLYAPAEGKYEGPWGASVFSGPMTVVDSFSTLSTGPGAEVITRNAATQVANMQQQVDTRIDTEASKTGATPIRVRLPLNGRQFRLEKILALPSDDLFFTMKYRDWDVAK